ncbi:hypothetical protein [Streptomyces sp. NBC_00019]|uniref:hypothetical protein n=1 Tax=Streptomyces sp. NBC_00019 TaxID=2975623 RepID=UPI00324F7CA2
MPDAEAGGQADALAARATTYISLTIAGQDKPLQRFIAGADAIEAAEAKAKQVLARPRPPANWATTSPTTTPQSERGPCH